jgi:poly(A)-specific ribonuclease
MLTMDTQDQPLVPVISRFEKRLVHQFADLVSLGKPDCIRIIRHDELREADNVKRMKGRLKESIAKQTGFRWVFEALAQGDINDADPFRCTSKSAIYTVLLTFNSRACHW